MYRSEVTPGIWVRSLLFFLLYNVMGIVHSLVSVLLAPLMRFEGRHRFVNLWTRASMWLLRRLNGVEIEVSGHEHIPRGEPVVVMANHQSQWETFYLQLLVFPQVTVLKRELLWVPFFGWGLALLQPIAIDRGKPVQAMKTVLREGKRRLDAGISVLIFPEGTRQPPGRIGRFNAGGAKLACHAGRRVLPIAHDAGHCWPARSILRRPGRIRLRIGPPIACEAGPEALIAETEQWIRDALAELGETERKAG
ncbi:lysophospholipid acyltransferase family protein [Thiorhodococcus minor]|uniref:1-acyl-sn-glycerol-3-phosphate acyltransferase n=1 Tax=Thiorhodococcus minor TaxID=57489 RepID=A0A6M0K0W6_9GAMM|nr:lysophospholipid acyltransferase family protein [Thiorhodococcus minor]NEV62981.1 1-acyl-sn-glycerol-3-phosphate acyltransferase [Thiorhodococcus minor]